MIKVVKSEIKNQQTIYLLETGVTITFDWTGDISASDLNEYEEVSRETGEEGVLETIGFRMIGKANAHPAQ